jgi:hypothetical protein
VTAKTELPHPYNLDLSGVLRSVDRRTPSGCHRIANDPVTAAYLAAGMRLLDRRLGPDGPARGVQDSKASSDRPLLRILSQRAVCDEVSNNPYPFVRIGRTSTLRSTWATQGDYVADLVRFALWNQHYVGVRPQELENYRKALAGEDFVAAIHAVGNAILASHIGQPRWRIQLIAAATAEADQEVARALTENYEEVIRTFGVLFNECLEAHGLTLRPGVSLADMTCLLMATAEGLALRAISGHEASIWNDDRSENLLGTSAVSFLLSCAQPSDERPEPLHEAFRARAARYAAH